MARFVAMLRGINVGGSKPVRMERLRGICEGLGFREVATYLQSGNVVFDAAQGRPEALERKLSKALERELGFQVPVLIRTKGELQAVFDKNPFLRGSAAATEGLHVTFLSAAPAKDSGGALSRLRPGTDRFVAVGREIYLHCPGGYGKTRLSNTAIEKALGLTATTRNWKTVGELLRLAGTI